MHLRTRGSPLLTHTVLSFVAALVFLIFTSSTSGQSATDSESASVSETSGESSEDLLKAAENPVADLFSIPIQNTTNFNIGPYRRTQNVVTLEPIIPLSLSENWMLVSRIIQPIIWQPYPDQRAGGVSGLGDMTPSSFITPGNPRSMIWGVGAATVIPVATSNVLGQGKLSLGPSAVLLAQPGHWTVGALVSNVWSIAGSGGRPPVNRMALEYFMSYNLPHEWYLTSSPTITADWRASPGNVWTLPIGVGVGKLVNFRDKVVDFSGAFYRNAKTPAAMPTWSMSLQATLLLPKQK